MTPFRHATFSPSAKYDTRAAGTGAQQRIDPF
jgi:hypothetical protein